jgi:hypothetical protein
MIEMENTYWAAKGTYQELNVKLESLVPASGEVAKPWKNKALERFRKASNAYYDVFNNGGCNRMQSISRLFGTEVSYALRNRRPSWVWIHKYTEPKMDAIILEAAKEQGLI